MGTNLRVSLPPKPPPMRFVLHTSLFIGTPRVLATYTCTNRPVAAAAIATQSHDIQSHLPKTLILAASEPLIWQRLGGR